MGTLPSNYTEIEYLQTVGGQYIDTGIIPTNHTTTVKYETSQYVNDAHLFGTTAGSTYYHFTFYNNKYYWGKNGGESSGGVYSNGLKTVIFNNADGNIYLDGSSIGSCSGATSSSSLQLFRRNTAANFVGKFYYCKIINRATSELVRDFVPCKRNSDGTIGVYDFVDGQFYTNAGTGVFISGPEKIDSFIFVKVDGQWKSTGLDSGAGESGKIDVIKVNGEIQEIVDKTVDITVPTKTSDLTNDSGYITNSALEPYAKTTDLPTKTSDLTNDSGFITSSQAPVQSVDGATGAVILNDVKYTEQILTDVQKTQARTNIGAGTSSFSGNYNDLSNKPTIPTVNNGVLTIQKNGTNVATFGANNSDNVTANITVPTSKSDIGLGNVDNIKQYSADNPPPYPVTSVNGQTGAVVIDVDLSTVLKLTGGTMQGVIDMGGYKITNVATPTNNTDAANKAYADSQKGVEVLTQSAQPTAQVTGDMWFQTT